MSSRYSNFHTRPIITFLLGALTVTGFAPFHLFPVPVITLALLFYLWRSSATPLQAALLGFCFGLGLFGAGVSWIYVSLHDFGAMPLPLAALATFLFCAFLALFPALVAWMLAKLQQLPPIIWALAAAALWMLSEWTRGWIFTGFPWLALGYSQVPLSPLAGFAPVAGVFGVSLGLAVSAALLCLWWEQGWRTRRAVLSFVLPLVAIFSVGFGLQKIEWTTPQGEPVTVSLLQGNIPQDLKWRADRVVNSMEVYASLAQQSNSRLIIMPETALPLLRSQAPPAYLAGLADHARKNNGDILIGMAEYVSSGNDGSSSEKNGGEYYNSLFSFGTAPEQRYRKHHLVPFGEFIPLKPVFGWIIHVLQIPLSDFSRGGLDQRPMNLAGQKVAVNICYEDVFGEEIINQLPAATLLVNVSNDAWFGHSIGPQQHLQISQMRALESGRMMLRATNTGVTAIINQRGVVLQEAKAFTTLALHGMAQGYSGATPFVRWGNALALGLAGLFLLIGLFPMISPVYRGTRKNL